jgi:hypothetical protein
MTGSGRPVRRSAVSAPVAGLLLAGAAAVLIAVALIAGRVGPWVATPPAGPAPTIRPPSVAVSSTVPFATPTGPQSQPEGSSPVWLLVVGIVITTIALLLLVIWLVKALRRPWGPTADAPSMNAVKSGIALSPAVEPERPTDDTDARTFDPRVSANAIIATWASVESSAAAAGCPRRAASTPTEFLAALEGSFPPPPGEDESDRVLLRLYHRARFDTGALSPGAAVAAADAADAIRRRLPGSGSSHHEHNAEVPS